MANPAKEFSKIFDSCIDKIYRFILIKVSSEDVAQDLTSETFLKAWEAYKASLNPGSSKIENTQAFLYRIARNLIVDYYRQKGRTQVVSAENTSLADPRPSMIQAVALSADIEQIKLGLTNLKDDYQNIIIWHYLDDLPMAEVARMMDKSEETARVTLHRALKALRQEMAKVRTA